MNLLNYEREKTMSKLIAFCTLAFAALPAFAIPVPSTQVPAPEALPLLGIGILAAVIARRLK